jgi:hypothetical protein
MSKYILLCFLSILLISCGEKNESEENKHKETLTTTDTVSYYQSAKNKVVEIFEDDEQNIEKTIIIDTVGYYQSAKNKIVELFEDDDQEEKIIKKKQKLSEKYEEYNAVKNWFETSNLEIFNKKRINFYKNVKTETTYKNETDITYFTTPDKGIRYCYLNDDYIYFIEFNYNGDTVNHYKIERLSRGLRFEVYETLTFNEEGKIKKQVENNDNFRYTISKSEEGFHEITYKNMLWELRGNEKLVTTLTLDTPQYESSWKDGIILNNLIIDIILYLIWTFCILLIGRLIFVSLKK